MKTIIIKEISAEHFDALSIYLVGGYDLEKQHIPALPHFRPGMKERLYDLCGRAERRDQVAVRAVEDMVIRLLSEALCMTLDGIEYIFDITRFECQRTMSLLVREVLAQVNEE